MKLIVTIFFTLLSFTILEAQEIRLEANFSELVGSFKSFNGNDNFEDWSFDNCYDSPDGALFVTNTGGFGSFTTELLDFYGNASVVLKIKRSKDLNTSIKASLIDVNGNIIVQIPSKVVANNEYSQINIYIEKCTPNTRIKIEGTAGKFYVENMRVYNVGDAIFYESFDHVLKGTEFYSSTDYVSAALCDNTQNSTLSGVFQSYQSLYLASKTGNYSISMLGINGITDALLSFKVAHLNDNNEIAISCSDDALIKPFNTTDIAVNGTTATLSRLGEPYKRWVEYGIIISNLSSSTTLTFNATLMSLNDVMIIPISNLDESKNNMFYITANAGQTLDVPLIRTLTPNTWCPLCLPFDVTQSQMETATGTTCELCTLTDIVDGEFVFDKTTSVSAGTPFLVKVDKQVVNPVFTGVIVVNTPAATATGTSSGYSFVGTYSPVSLNTDGTHLFLDKQGNLCQPDSEEGYNRLNGLRAYFVVPDPSKARVFISDTTSEVSRINTTPVVHNDTYDLNGRHVEASYSKGLRIQNGHKFFTR